MNVPLRTLYEKEFEHDSCGVGFVADIKGRASHQIIKDGVTILKNLVHRGALGGDMKTGDGAGMLLQIPHGYFSELARKAGALLPEKNFYGAGFFFMPQKATERRALEKATEDIISGEGGSIVFRRDVPVKPDCLGKIARDSMPFMKQFFVSFKGLSGGELERKLYVTRRLLEKEALRMKAEDFYISSFSSRTIIYKGMFAAPQFEAFYPELKEKKFKSAFALVHQRYSTNTFPSWAMAQPFRGMAHNGEINTIRGNMSYMRAREATLESPLFGGDIKKIFPVVTEGASDSAIFDNTLELLVSAGRPVEHAMMMMVPEAFGRKYHISEDKRSFYEYHSAFMEPWDGPAAIVFTDGEKIGASLDRNGLRPLRYLISRSGKFSAASEAGVLDIAPGDVLEKGRLAPGKMILVDTVEGRVKKDSEIKASVSRRKLYRRWLEQNRIELKGLFQPSGAVKVERESLATRQKMFGYDFEELNTIIAPMAENAQEPVGSMGDDEAPAVLSERPQTLFRYFKQLFAQVTNPPIDPYRENLVMSLMSFIGRERNLLGETPLHCRQLKLAHPVLTNSDMEKLKCVNIRDFNSAVVPMLFDPSKGPGELKKAVHILCKEVEKKTDEGYSLVIISDRGADREHAPIPSLLAVSSVNRHLVSHGKRHLIGLVVETGEARQVTDFAALIAFGSSAVNPYLAFETLAALKKDNMISEGLRSEDAIDNYITAVKKGLLKIMSKMGVSTIRSYKGALMFEALGLNSKFAAKYFGGVPSRIEGIGIDEIGAETIQRHEEAFAPSESSALPAGGHYSYRRFSQKHLMIPEAVAALQKAVREGDYGLYEKYAALINEQSSNLCTLRGLFSFKKAKAVPLNEVEPVESIVKRFVTSAMSFGSISKEAHETMAIAMNRLGAASNSGEGGEDSARYKTLPSGDSLMSAVKQVASGRFGVSINYLVNARELQIKMAQGAKPGEGGQLPGHKVNKAIADIRYSTPGVMLISPPPHHDIYSIEDLAQLIFDLKNANDSARISVKLVSEAGVGTVAAGVAKGKADMVLISGGDGGTGASPLSSIKQAGIPWEMGLAETQQTLVMNKLRERIKLQADGQMRTGRDIVVAALLGAEEYGFGTVALVTLGCLLVRKCHLNTCPVGIATQDEKLRKRFGGKPEHVVNFMRFVAEDARRIMAELGFRTFDEMIGRSDMLKSEKALSHWKAKGLDFGKIFARSSEGPRRYMSPQKHDFSESLDRDIIKKAAPALNKKKRVTLEYKIRNRNRTVGTMLSSRVARLYGEVGLPENTIRCKFTGVAGQSFGAFLAKGVTLELEGDSNDYMGKGLSGGRIIVYPSKGSKFRSQNNIITGNVCLFGATGGEAFIRGMAGERFAVRNSGATAVVEGAGDHACEYMTGGRVVILGATGVNFAAGMSGGIAYVLDENQLFDTRCNLEMVDLGAVTEKSDEEFLYKLIKRHVQLTGSAYAARILRDWDSILPMFVKVMPIDYRKALERIKREQLKDSEVETITEEIFD